MPTSTIGNDVQELDNFAGAPDTEFDVDDAAEAFISQWKKKQDPQEAVSSEADKEQAPPAQKETTEEEDAEHADDDSGSEDQTDHEDEDTSEDGGKTDDHKDGKKAETSLVSDDNEVEVTVDGETRRVPVKDLKRLYGQEASLTRKSQEVADQRKQSDDRFKALNTGLQKMLDRAQKKWEPFAKIDFILAAKQMNADEYTQLRHAAQSAYEDVKFYREELGTHVEADQQQRRAALQTQAVECVKALEDPEKGIKGWNQQMYNELREFSSEHGLAPEYFNRLVDPAAFKIIRMAQQFAKAQKVGVKKVEQAPKNIQKSKNTRTNTDAQRTSQARAMQKLRNSGDVDDAADVYLQRWNAADDRD